MFKNVLGLLLLFLFASNIACGDEGGEANQSADCLFGRIQQALNKIPHERLPAKFRTKEDK